MHFIYIMPGMTKGKSNYVSKVWVADNGDGTYETLC